MTKQEYKNKCRECGGKCKIGKALMPVGYVKDKDGEGFYLSDSKGLTACQKCTNCGHSFILPSPKISLFKHKT